MISTSRQRVSFLRLDKIKSDSCHGEICRVGAGDAFGGCFKSRIFQGAYFISVAWQTGIPYKLSSFTCMKVCLLFFILDDSIVRAGRPLNVA